MLTQAIAATRDKSRVAAIAAAKPKAVIFT